LLCTRTTLFILYRNGYVRYLLSVPTRRSSDLKNKDVDIVQFALQTDSIEIEDADDDESDNEEEDKNLWDRFLSSSLSLSSSSASDRKSTRLNSSHVSISYAVFCLKKKNNKFKT